MKRILFIDDEIFSIRRIIEELEEIDSYEVTAIESLYEAMTLLTKEVYDLLVLDIMLPHENVFKQSVPAKNAGIEFIKKLKNNELNLTVLEANTRINIIVLTAVTNPTAINEIISQKPFSLLRKPITWQQFLSEVQNCFDQ